MNERKGSHDQPQPDLTNVYGLYTHLRYTRSAGQQILDDFPLIVDSGPLKFGNHDQRRMHELEAELEFNIIEEVIARKLGSETRDLRDAHKVSTLAKTEANMGREGFTLQTLQTSRHEEVSIEQKKEQRGIFSFLRGRKK